MKWLEQIKYRWWRANHQHDWKYRDVIVGIHHEHGPYTLKECQDPKCRQVETVYVSANYGNNSLNGTVKHE